MKLRWVVGCLACVAAIAGAVAAVPWDVVARSMIGYGPTIGPGRYPKATLKLAYRPGPNGDAVKALGNFLKANGFRAQQAVDPNFRLFLWSFRRDDGVEIMISRYTLDMGPDVRLYEAAPDPRPYEDLWQRLGEAMAPFQQPVLPAISIPFDTGTVPVEPMVQAVRLLTAQGFVAQTGFLPYEPIFRWSFYRSDGVEIRFTRRTRDQPVFVELYQYEVAVSDYRLSWGEVVSLFEQLPPH